MTNATQQQHVGWNTSYRQAVYWASIPCAKINVLVHVLSVGTIAIKSTISVTGLYIDDYCILRAESMYWDHHHHHFLHARTSSSSVVTTASC
jgi:hypothetical protein